MYSAHCLLNGLRLRLAWLLHSLLSWLIALTCTHLNGLICMRTDEGAGRVIPLPSFVVVIVCRVYSSYIIQVYVCLCVSMHFAAFKLLYCLDGALVWFCDYLRLWRLVWLLFGLL